MNFKENILIIILAFILGCSHHEKQSKNTELKPLDVIANENLISKVDTILLENEKVFNAIKVKKRNGKVCFSYNLDSLQNDNQDLFSFNFKDLTNGIDLVNWNFFIGYIKVNKLASNKYEFIGQCYLPNNGDWDKEFKQYDLMRHVIEVNADHYLFYEDITLHKKFDIANLEVKIAKIEKQIYSDSTCVSSNWDRAIECFKKIKRYEFLLLASSLNGNKESINKFLNLNNKISITNAAEFSEYHTGHILLLNLYGIVNKNQYDPQKYFKIVKHGNYCY